MGKSIGILGASGHVGCGAMDVLLGKRKVLAGCRRPEQVCHTGIRTRKVDLRDPLQLEQYVEDCELVINCAGPAAEVLDKVGKACVKKGVSYIDVAGNQAMADALQEIYTAEGSAILSAGVYPGLCEIFLLWVLGRQEEKPSQVEEIFCGNAVLSTTALKDICEAIKDGEGEAFCYMKNGKRQTFDAPARDGMRIPGKNEEVYLLPMLYQEFAQICQKRALDKAIFYQGMEGADGVERLIRLKEQISQGAERDYLEEAQSVFGGEDGDAWFDIIVDLSFEETAVRYVLQSKKDWNYMSGAVAAVLALTLGERRERGLFRAWELADAQQVLLSLKECGLCSIKKYKRH